MIVSSCNEPRWNFGRIGSFSSFDEGTRYLLVEEALADDGRREKSRSHFRSCLRYRPAKFIWLKKMRKRQRRAKHRHDLSCDTDSRVLRSILHTALGKDASVWSAESSPERGFPTFDAEP